MNKLLAFLGAHEVSFAFLPAGFKINKRCNQISVVFKLRIYSFDVFFVLSEQCPECLQTLPDSFSQLSDCLALWAGDSSADAFSLEQDFHLQVVSSFSVRVCNCVYFVYHFNQFFAVLIVICALNHYFAFRSFSHFSWSYFFLNINSFLNIPPCVLFNKHELYHVKFLILYPVTVELFKNASDFIYKFNNVLVILLFTDSLIRLFCIIQKLAEILK